MAERETEQPTYIGIHSLYDPGTEATLIRDWRAPISSMFYEFELGMPKFPISSMRPTIR